MAKSAFLNTRIDPVLKLEAENVFEGIGVSSSQAITMFYQQVVLRRGLPFEVRLPNAETVAALKEADAGKGETSRGTTADAFDGILKE